MRRNHMFGTVLLALATALFPATAWAQAAATSATVPAISADARLRALYTAEWDWRQAEFAQISDGQRLRDDDHLPSVTAEAQQRRLDYWTRTLAALDAIPAAQLSPEEALNAAVFRQSIWALAMNQRYKTYEAPFNSDTFFWGGLDAGQPLDSTEEYRRYLGRMADVPRFLAENIANMRAGIKRGYSVPRVTITGRDTTIEPYADPGAGNPFLAAFAKLPDTIPAAQQAAMRTRAEALVREKIAPAYAELLNFMRTEYMPAPGSA